MGKIDYRRLTPKKYKLLGKEFWETCMSASSTEELARFFAGALLPSEKVMVVRRIKAAKRILNGEPQTKIISDLHIGKSTVDKVEQWVSKADEGTKKMLK